MRDNFFNLHVDLVRSEMTGTQQILISRICYFDKGKSKDILTYVYLLHVCSTGEVESESVITD